MAYRKRCVCRARVFDKQHPDTPVFSVSEVVTREPNYDRHGAVRTEILTILKKGDVDLRFWWVC